MFAGSKDFGFCQECGLRMGIQPPTPTGSDRRAFLVVAGTATSTLGTVFGGLILDAIHHKGPQQIAGNAAIVEQGDTLSASATVFAPTMRAVAEFPAPTVTVT